MPHELDDNWRENKYDELNEARVRARKYGIMEAGNYLFSKGERKLAHELYALADEIGTTIPCDDAVRKTGALKFAMSWLFGTEIH